MGAPRSRSGRRADWRLSALLGLATTAFLYGARSGTGYSDGPPPAHTGGFGEPTCHRCHFDRPINDGAGSLTLSGLPDAYTPGATYSVAVQLTRSGMRRAGFQLAARFASGAHAGRQAGSLSAVDEATEVRRHGVPAIEYAQHANAGAAVASPGRARWIVEWRAPGEAIAPVILHFVGNAGDGDASELDDFIYIDSLTVGPKPAVARQAQWTAQSSGTSAEFRGLSAASSSVVWAAGRNGTYARTADGGSTWRSDTVPGASSLFFIDVYAVDERTAYLLGTHFEGGLARIYKTTDAGAHWAVQYSDERPGVFFDGMAFWDAGSGIAFGDPVDGRLLIVTTGDGGRTWTEVPAAGLPPALPGEAGFAASGTAIAVRGTAHVWIGTGGGDVARVYRSTDRGRTWTVAATPLEAGSTAGIFGIAFSDTLNGIAVGGDYTRPSEASENVVRTRDGGRTWEPAGSSAPAGVRYGAAYVGGEAGGFFVAVGPSGWGYSTDLGTTWTTIDTLGYNAVTPTSSGPSWVGGVDGRIAKLRTAEIGR